MTAQQPPLALSVEFENSYIGCAQYPTNIIYKSPYSLANEERRKQFESCANALLTPDAPALAAGPAGSPPPEQPLYVVFKDWNPTANKFDKFNAFGDTELKTWLGDVTNYATTQPASRPSIQLTKPDPRCRFIFLWAENSRRKLKVSQEMLLRIFSYHQVMPSYLDFISVFGERTDKGDKVFSGRSLRFIGFQLRNAACNKRVALASHGRSGRAYEMCYNLKMASDVSEGEKKNWSVRQGAFYHQFDVETGQTLWMSTKGGLNDLKKKVELLTGAEGLPEDRSFSTVVQCFRSSLAVQLLYCYWSVDGWRNYLEYLENKIERISQDAVNSPLDRYYSRQYKPDELQEMQRATDRTHEAIMVIEGNINVMIRIQGFYKNLLKNNNFSQAVCGGTVNLQVINNLESHVAWFNLRIDGIISDMRMHISRARLLVEISADRNNIILQQLHGYSTDKMQIMTSVSIHEAVMMRVITVGTMIFLPATFVSTFFSTDIVKYQGEGNGGGVFSLIALDRWLQVTLPLTVIVLGISFLFYKRARAKREREVLPMYRPDKS